VEFEWNDEKAASNIKKHGISFLDASEAFRDPNIVEDLDLKDNYDEERLIAYAKLDGQVLVIVYTMREEIYKIISARRAEKNEQHYYHSENRA
jgi:uncharacterized protein